MNDDLILAIDGGTQSVRAALIDVQGRMVDMARASIQPYFSAEPGFAEQDCDYYWRSLCSASRQVMARNSENARRIVGVTVTTQRGVYINLGKDGRPLRPAINWLDQRLASSTKWAPWVIESAMRVAGLWRDLDKVYRQGFSNWIREHQPDIWAQTHQYLLLSGYFHYQLTGEYAESLGTNFGYMPVDGKTFQWARPKALVNLVFPIEREKLPDLVPQGGVLGRVTDKACAESGIPAGLPVLAAACDKSCETLGNGITGPDIACLSLGTCATIDAVSDKYVELLPFLPPYPGAIPGTYCCEIPIVRGFWMVSWFKEEFGHPERMAARERGVSPEELLEEAIRNVPAGSYGLMLQPYWSPNRVYSGKEGRGAVVGWVDTHARPHLYRAILEGLMYALRDGAALTERKVKTKFTGLRVSGGGSKSTTALQIAADVFNLAVEVPQNPETASLGAAMNAAVGLGYYKDYPAAVQGMTHIGRTVQPIPKNRDLYEQLYQRVYRKLYRQLEPLYKELWDIAETFPAETHLPQQAPAQEANGATE
jgi:sugar (pentulose or hexulose) kinase